MIKGLCLLLCLKIICFICLCFQAETSILFEISSQNKLKVVIETIFFCTMSTTRSQKKRNIQQESTENVSECLASPIVTSNDRPLEQDIGSAGLSGAKSPRIENSTLERLRTSFKDEITSELKNLLVESQKEILKLLKPKT